jgi:hypothetical protein
MLIGARTKRCPRQDHDPTLREVVEFYVKDLSARKPHARLGSLPLLVQYRGA